MAMKFMHDEGIGCAVGFAIIFLGNMLSGGSFYVSFLWGLTSTGMALGLIWIINEVLS